jgi:RNA polymerase sigma factor (sigma-70 family)
LVELKKKWLLETLKLTQGKLVDYTRRITGNDEVARELVQEAFLRLWQDVQIRTQAEMLPWLYTVCRNLAIDHRRKEKPMQPGYEETMDALASNPEDPLEAADAQTQVLGCMQKLTPRQKELIRLKFQHDLSYKEIAQVTGMTVTNVGFALHKAIATLREEMQSRGAK